MKFTKMSLMAVMLIGSSVLARENLEMDGDVRLFYSSSDKANTLFDKSNSLEEVGLRISATEDFTEFVSAKATLYAVTPMGFTYNLAEGSWTGGQTTNAWMGEVFVKAKAGNTITELGRMELDTPLVFTETWSIVPNTFESVLVVNEDIPSTTLSAAYVGRHNSGVIGGGVTDITIAGQTDARGDIYSDFYEGAYAFGASNNSWKPLTAQAWVYLAQHAVNTYWLQADLNMDGILAGLQYTGGDYYQAGANNENVTGTAMAAMLGYQMGDTLTVKASFSQTSKDIGHGGNLATQQVAGAQQSKLYTEAWWNYGRIVLADTISMNFTAEYSAEDIADFGLYVTRADTTNVGTMNEATVSASKSFGHLDTSLVGIYSKIDSIDGTTIQAYLTYNFDIKKK